MSWFLSQLHELTFLSMVLRFLTATLAGAVIGYSRGKAQHAAGLRTHILVCIGAAGAMIVGEYLVSVKGFDTDAARIPAQVISGIGFLGAGSIMTGGKLEVRGLTTAAGLWTAACIGLAVGIGFYAGGILGTAAVYLTVSCLKPVAYRFSRDHNRFGLYIEVKRMEYLPVVYKLIEEFDGYLSDKEVSECREDGSCGAVLSIKLPREKMPEEIMEMLSLEPFVKDVKFINYNI